MERLIVEYSVGDGYNYSSDIVTPIVYKDKESAINDLQLVVMEYLEKLETFEKIKENFSKNQRNLHSQIRKVEKNPKKQDEKNALTLELLTSYNEYSTLRQELSDEFYFGGAQFNYNNFYYQSEGKYEVSIPNISTLDEFYYSAETMVNAVPSSKPKMK